MARRKKVPPPLNMPQVVATWHRRRDSVASISSAILSSALTGSFPSTPGLAPRNAPLLAVTLGLEEGLKQQLKEDEERREKRKNAATERDVSSELARMDGDERARRAAGRKKGLQERRIGGEKREKNVVIPKLRYFEGIPGHEGERQEESAARGGSGAPGVERELGEWTGNPEGVQERCLQCRVRNLRCSLMRELMGLKKGGIWRGRPCSRCARHGDEDECLVEVETVTDKLTSWQFAKLDLTASPYSPPTEFQARVTRRQEVVLVNFKDETRKREVLEKWMDQGDKVVVDAIANRIGQVKTSAFAPSKPLDETELRPFAHKEDGDDCSSLMSVGSMGRTY